MATLRRMARGPEYRSKHIRARRKLLEGSPLCYHCGLRFASIADHDPPLALVPEGQKWVGTLRPSCVECSQRQSNELSGVRTRLRRGIPLPSRQW